MKDIDKIDKEKFNEYAVYLENVLSKTLGMMETECLVNWLDGGITYADITKAYGITMKRCENFSFHYMNAILMNLIKERRN